MASDSQRPERRTLAAELYDALDTAAGVVKEFKARHKRFPSEIELRCATMLFIEIQRSGGRRILSKKWKTAGNHSGRNNAPNDRRQGDDSGE